MSAVRTAGAAVPATPVKNVTSGEWGFAIGLGIAVSLSLWHGLLSGQELTGGDTWPYFLPQKLLLAESFADGQIPLWHDLTGLGYPLLAESQAGVFYPTNQVLYRILNPAQAYHAGIILHYVFAFVFCWRFARCQELSCRASLLVALVYVCGWFPARVSLEWAIIGGVWLPLTLWQTHELLRRPAAWRFALLATCLSLHLLAGHFTLAFINQLAMLGYTGLRIILQPAARRPPWRAVTGVPLAIAVSFLVASVQLWPTLELKQDSQREGANGVFDPGYGHLPPLYLTQLVASWTWWHTPEIRQSGMMQRLPGSIASDTNAVEAHFYLGLIPLVLAGSSLIPGVARRMVAVPRRCWLILGAAAVVYATGWLLPVTRHLPGFSFFMGPGRFTIVATLAGALLSGMVIDVLCPRVVTGWAVVIVIATLTWIDLRWSSEPIADAELVSSIWPEREHSWIRDYFLQQPPRTCRLLASGPNVGNLFEVSCVPQYLGLGPAVYFTDAFALEPFPDQDTFPTAEQLQKLDDLAVTHILTTERVLRPADAIELVAAEPDALLNRIWGRGGQSCFLYRLLHPAERLSSEPPAALSGWRCTIDTPQVVEFEVALNEPAVVHLRELMYPGWVATVNGTRSDSVESGPLHRSVRLTAGQHRLRWQFQPASFRMGAAVSFVSLSILWLAAIAVSRRQHSRESQR